MLADGTAVCIRTFCCAKAGPASPANVSAISADNAFLRNMVALQKPRQKASYFYDSHASELAPVSRGGNTQLPYGELPEKTNCAACGGDKKFFTTARVCRITSANSMALMRRSASYGETMTTKPRQRCSMLVAPSRTV